MMYFKYHDENKEPNNSSSQGDQFLNLLSKTKMNHGSRTSNYQSWLGMELISPGLGTDFKSKLWKKLTSTQVQLANQQQSYSATCIRLKNSKHDLKQGNIKLQKAIRKELVLEIDRKFRVKKTKISKKQR